MFSLTLMPRFCDTDALGHINNTLLPVWFEQARDPVFRFFTPDLNPADWRLIVAKIELEFKRELFYGREVEIITSVQRIGNASFQLLQQA
jgi:acyl-CoA thioester hydrolase